MKRKIFKAYCIILTWVSLPVVLSELFDPRSGKEYRISFLKKLRLVYMMWRNTKKIPCASHFIEHLVMATRIMNIPSSVEGGVVECGVYKGGSSANLSLICKLCGRHLDLFDSFQGLPSPSDVDIKHTCVDVEQIHTYTSGAWCGGFEEVQHNIVRYGVSQECSFHKGFFKDTLPRFKKKCVFIFLDVDLRDSLATCLKYLWPLLQKNCYLFTHEATHQEVFSLFFEQAWWMSHFGIVAPGLIGAGCGLGLIPKAGGFKSSLGFIVKEPDTSSYLKVDQNAQWLE